MDMNQLFKSLPSDLQWEILSDFVGTHAVRNGKLMRKLIVDINSDQIKYSIRDRPCYNWIYNIPSDEANNRRFAQFPANGTYLMCCRDFRTDETIYLYRKMIQLHSVWDFIWEIRFEPVSSNDLTDSIVLPPFIKQSYPSYPYTNKKMARRA
jgi:hypothetical protein